MLEGSIKTNKSMILPCPPPTPPSQEDAQGEGGGGGACQNHWFIGFYWNFKHFFGLFCFLWFFLVFLSDFNVFLCKSMFYQDFFSFCNQIMVFLYIPLISNTRWSPRGIQRHPEAHRRHPGTPTSAPPPPLPGGCSDHGVIQRGLLLIFLIEKVWNQ